MTIAEVPGRLCRVEHIMGTAIVIDVRDPADSAAAATAIKAAFDHFRAVDARFSTYKADSEVSRLNRAELREQDCSQELRDVLGMCAGRTPGERRLLRHPGTCAVTERWIRQAWSRAGRSMARRRSLMRPGLRNYTINAAGDLVTRGDSEPGQPWRIGIRNPWDASTTAVVVSR